MTVHRVLRERRRLDRHILDTPGIGAWHVMNAAYAWIAAEARPVVISVHGNDFLEPYIPVERPNIDGLPVLWRTNGMFPKLEAWIGRVLTRLSVNRNLPRARAILANSRYTGQALLDHIPKCAGKVIPAMVGVSPDFLVPMETPRTNKALELVTVCRLDEQRKNVDLVLRALARLAHEFEFHYRVVGEGKRREALTSLATTLGIGERVTFTGRLPFEALRTHLAQAELFVLPASIAPGSHEGFGIAYIEANACGTPVLAARLAGAEEAVEEGRSGYFIDAVSVEALEAALRHFLAGEVRFDPTACREFAQRFTWSQVVEAALPYYQLDAKGPVSR